MNLTETIDALLYYDTHISRIDEQQRTIDALRAQVATLQGQLAAAVDKAQLYEGLYRDVMTRKAQEARR